MDCGGYWRRAMRLERAGGLTRRAPARADLSARALPSGGGAELRGDHPVDGGLEELLALGGAAAGSVPVEAHALGGGFTAGHHAALLVGEDVPGAGVELRDLDGVGAQAATAHQA